LVSTRASGEAEKIFLAIYKKWNKYFSKRFWHFSKMFSFN
jgi:hypothetical protein